MKRLSDIFTIITGVVVSDLGVSKTPRDDSYLPVIRPSHSFQKVIAGFISSSSVPESKVFAPGTLMVSTDGQGSHSHSYVIPYQFIPNSNVSVLLPRGVMSLKEKLFSEDSDWKSTTDSLRAAEAEERKLREKATSTALSKPHDPQSPKDVASDARATIAQAQAKLRQLGVKTAKSNSHGSSSQ